MPSKTRDETAPGHLYEREPPKQAEEESQETNSLLDDLRRAMMDAPTSDVREKISTLIKQLAIVKTAKVKLKVRLDNLRVDVEGEMAEMHDSGLRQLVSRYMDAIDDWQFYDYNEHKVIYQFITDDFLPKAIESRKLEAIDDDGPDIGEAIEDEKPAGRQQTDGRHQPGEVFLSRFGVSPDMKEFKREEEVISPEKTRKAIDNDSLGELRVFAGDDDGDLRPLRESDGRVERSLIEEARAETRRQQEAPDTHDDDDSGEDDDEGMPSPKTDGRRPTAYGRQYSSEARGGQRDSSGSERIPVANMRPWIDDVKERMASYKKHKEEWDFIKGRPSKRYRRGELDRLLDDDLHSLRDLTIDSRCKDAAKAKSLIEKHIGITLDGRGVA